MQQLQAHVDRMLATESAGNPVNDEGSGRHPQATSPDCVPRGWCEHSGAVVHDRVRHEAWQVTVQHFRRARARAPCRNNHSATMLDKPGQGLARGRSHTVGPQLWVTAGSAKAPVHINDHHAGGSGATAGGRHGGLHHHLGRSEGSRSERRPAASGEFDKFQCRLYRFTNNTANHGSRDLERLASRRSLAH